MCNFAIAQFIYYFVKSIYETVFRFGYLWDYWDYWVMVVVFGIIGSWWSWGCLWDYWVMVVLGLSLGLLGPGGSY